MRVDRPQPRRDQRVGSRGDLALELLVERRCRGHDGHTALEVLAMQPVERRAAHGLASAEVLLVEGNASACIFFG